jgi:hypothetical protein
MRVTTIEALPHIAVLHRSELLNDEAVETLVVGVAGPDGRVSR